MADKPYENIPDRSKPKKDSGETIRSTATKLPAKVDPKKDTTPLPEWLKNERENQERDNRVKREQEAYDKYDKNRLKDQGSFKKGGSVKSASSRADGCCTKGKTKGRMV
jgi:hypothetical protein